ncbi:uncharacterized protein LOC105849483 isoform X2 [Hydra vulgaris]|uniref:uncharacterized protein LOC105849483 isoform X2 n=1 Tax=Hydra vulgaris TaxID=6087 RepID=UPI0032EA5627
MDGFLQNPEFQIKLSKLLDQDWFEIGILLNVKQRSLVSIRNDSIIFPKQKDKAFEMIQTWFSFDKNPTFEHLKQAILKIPNHGLLKEVEDLASRFFTMPSYLSEGASNTEISSLPNKDSTVSSNKGIYVRLHIQVFWS